MFNTDSDRRDRTIGHWLRWSEFTPPRCFLRLDAGDPVEDKTLEAHILVAATAVWQGIALELSPAVIMRLPFRRGTQAAAVTGLIAHEEVFERMAFLLAAVGVLLVLGIGGAVVGRAGPSCPTGGWGTSRPSPASRTSRHTLRRFGPEAALGRLKPDSTRDAGREARGSHAIGSSQRAVLARLEWDAVAHTSACRAVSRLSWVTDNGHRDDHDGWCGVAPQWYGPADRPPMQARNAAAAPRMLVG